MTDAPFMPFPFSEAPFRLSLGLQLLGPGDWIRIDADWQQDRALKHRLLEQQRDQVFVTLPGHEAAQGEVLTVLRAHLLQYHPERFRAAPNNTAGLAVHENGVWTSPSAPDGRETPPLLTAALLVQEDLVLMHGGTDGRFSLVAASVSFPTRWKLREKLGKPIDIIHAPVPDLEKRIGRQIKRLFQSFTVDKPLVRENWSVMDDDRLFQPTGHGRTAANEALRPETVGNKLWLRVERQCLHRLPESQDILFSIRIYQATLAEVITTPKRAELMHAALKTMPRDLQLYKSLPIFQQALHGFLDQKMAQ